MRAEKKPIFLFLQVFLQPYLPLIRRCYLFIREGLFCGVYTEHNECARNDNVPSVIKDIARVIARVLSEAISRFHNGELVAAVPRYGINDIVIQKTNRLFQTTD
ncbi:MAG: hypothetical protein DCC43_03570 [Candidatus Brocadia sp.]|jgi:hypothetical protein|uniref:Uncharacterized protein n=1 Tax=Candidatus Brocadia fulgida TaxID=380242 RepID=A0A0M2UTU7_9BACT|nr:MAG: hypothetical protein BROFUL_02917 [Candidatus Brocadia fulgida]MBV6518311.1 hypothetical protein [Candidatus Brocadia fulgida]MCE7911187.1 hypothetical protein [Candidatus Brocadia sp. AMX3]OQZ01652.1 MAG: hypothetical protein B6D35_02535 [Candidatus Brocadia sp. UTAMX2]RIK02309.1 MAG: hypothetical protein DCC43_03570 [Candidatus Brocadia sp.]